MRLSTFGHLVGQLLLRTLDRAERIHLAMLCRGFDGTIRIRATSRVTGRDLLCFGGCCAIFLFFRFYDLPALTEKLLKGFVP